MLLWTVNTQSLGGNLKFTRRVPKRQEREDPHQDADRIGLESFQGPDIHCLRTSGTLLAAETCLCLESILGGKLTNRAANFQSIHA